MTGLAVYRNGVTIMIKQPAIYILANQQNGTLYIGVTSNLVKRVWEHKSDFVEGFTRRYAVHMLVYYELLDTMDAAITREKQIKAGSRTKKIQLIETMNSEWLDLYDSIV
jgi:putative endonuclease